MKLKLNAHRPSHRNRWELVLNGVVTRDELLLFEFYIDQMDFDIHHEEFGTVAVNFNEITKLFGYKSSNSVRTKHQKLLELGFIHSTSTKGTLLIHNPLRYVASTPKWKGQANECVENELGRQLHEYISSIASNVHLSETNVQSAEHKVQSIEQLPTQQIERADARYLVSSKVASLTVIEKPEIRSDAFYEQVHAEGIALGLTIDDMRWIDEHQQPDGSYFK